MSTNSDPGFLNLEFYRKQAKTLLKAANSDDPVAFQRIGIHWRENNPIRKPALYDAQLTIAREQGFASWPRFKAFITESRFDYQSLLTTFIDAALSDTRRAAELLAAHPEISGAGLYPALVLGDAARVRAALDENPSLVSLEAGPRNWYPILYVCFSHFAHRQSSFAGALTETAQLLLRHGADPNASYISEQWPDNPLPCLYGAAGVNNNPDLALALLQAGARVDDSESLYHSTEHADLTCLKLLLQHGASPRATNALKHMLDREDIEGLTLLLAAGADPNEVNGRGETALHWAVWRGRSVKIIEILLLNGLQINAKRQDGRTAYALAVQSGQSETAALLARHGAIMELSPVDRFLAAAETLAPDAATGMQAELLKNAHSRENERLVPDLARIHRTPAVRALLAAGMPVNARGDMGATALHWACWKGYADLVQLLIEHGASFTVEDLHFHGTPAGWFAHGLSNCDEPGGDYSQVARLLLAAGAVIPAADLPTGNAAVDAVLREYSVIP